VEVLSRAIAQRKQLRISDLERSGTEPIGHLTALRRMKRFFGLRPQNDKRALAGS